MIWCQITPSPVPCFLHAITFQISTDLYPYFMPIYLLPTHECLYSQYIVLNPVLRILAIAAPPLCLHVLLPALDKALGPMQRHQVGFHCHDACGGRPPYSIPPCLPELSHPFVFPKADVESWPGKPAFRIMLHLYAMFSACVAVATSPVNMPLFLLFGLSTGVANLPCLGACHDMIQRKNESNRVRHYDAGRP